MSHPGNKQAIYKAWVYVLQSLLWMFSENPNTEEDLNNLIIYLTCKEDLQKNIMKWLRPLKKQGNIEL